MTRMTRLSLTALAILLTGVAVAMIAGVVTDCYNYASPLGITGVAAFAAPRQQRRNPQQSSSSQSPSSSSGTRKKKPSMGGNANWYNKRKAGVKVKSNGPKPPKWEKEGDNLYVNHNSAVRNDEEEGEGDDGALKQKIVVNHKNTTYEEARALLRPFEDKAAGAASTTQQLPPKDDASDDIDDEPAEPEQPFLWGELSIGPVWKSRLVRAGYSKPTPIQVASYTALTNKKNRTSTNGNAVIAASTGSGKSLAYLLPFLTSIDTDNRKQKMKQRKNTQNHGPEPSFASVTSSLGRIWIMTPTMELAYQLQRTVDRVIVGDENLVSGEGEDSSSSSNVFHVVEYNKGTGQPKGNGGQEFSFSTSYPILSDIVHRFYITDATISQEPTFLAGTPKLFLQLRKEIKKILASTTKVDSNIRYAKQRQARKLREASEGIDEDSDDGDDDTNEKETVEEQLLYRKVALALEGNLETLILDEVDRLLQTTTAMARREHKTTKPLAQELLDALVWESKKRPSSSSRSALGASGGKKKSRQTFVNYNSSDSSKLQIVCASATIGRSLRRQLMYTIRAPSMDKAALLVTADVRTKKNADLRKASLLPSNLKHSFQIVSSDSKKKDASTKTLQALVTTLTIQEPQAPSLVFPGTIGVETVRDHLLTSGFRDVRGLSSLRSGKVNDGDSLSPMDTPVYVVKERLARGLDLPHVKRVLLLGVPSNAAAYAHLAGRTARQNTPGDCTVLCKPSEAHKLVSIAETLGLHEWSCLDGDADDDDNVVSPATTSETSEVPSGTMASSSEGGAGGDQGDLAAMNKTALKSKKVKELREFLESKGVSTKGLLKNSLVDAVLQLKEMG